MEFSNTSHSADQDEYSTPTPSEIDDAIISLEIRSEEISHGGNADILLEEEPS